MSSERGGDSYEIDNSSAESKVENVASEQQENQQTNVKEVLHNSEISYEKLDRRSIYCYYFTAGKSSIMSFITLLAFASSQFFVSSADYFVAYW